MRESSSLKPLNISDSHFSIENISMTGEKKSCKWSSYAVKAVKKCFWSYTAKTSWVANSVSDMHRLEQYFWHSIVLCLVHDPQGTGTQWVRCLRTCPRWNYCFLWRHTCHSPSYSPAATYLAPTSCNTNICLLYMGVRVIFAQGANQMLINIIITMWRSLHCAIFNSMNITYIMPYAL